MAFDIKAFARKCVIASGKLTGLARSALGKNADIPIGVQKMHDDIENNVKELLGTGDKSKPKEAKKDGMPKDSRDEQDEI